MVVHITVDEANAWADHSKLNFGELDSDLEASQATQVLTKVSQVYDVTSWITPGTTPALIRKIISMLYVGWYYQRTYSEDGNLIAGIISGAITLPDVPPGTDLGFSQPVFYPTDASSALQPTDDDPSLGPAKFSMGRIW